MELVHIVAHPGRPEGEDDGPTPAVIAIHGRGAHAQDLLGLAPFIAGGRLLMICPEAEFVLQPGQLSFTWFNLEPDGGRTSGEFERVAGVLDGFIDRAVERYGADPERLALLGFSQGGTLAYRLGLAFPERFAAVAALSTWLPDEAVEHADQGEALSRLPVLVQHGSRDPLVDVARARDSRERLQQLGVEADYREYEMEHQIGPESMRDLSNFLEGALGLEQPDPKSNGAD